MWTPDLTGAGKSCSGIAGQGCAIQLQLSLPIGSTELEFYEIFISFILKNSFEKNWVIKVLYKKVQIAQDIQVFY